MTDKIIGLMADAVLEDLEDRNGIRQAFDSFKWDDPEIYEEIRQAIGRAALTAFMDATQEPSEAMLNLLNNMMGGNDEGLTARWQAMHDKQREEALG